MVNFPTLVQDTIEIKNVSSPRLDAIVKNIKRGYEQSNYLIIDITYAGKEHPTSDVFKECKRYFDNPDHNWLDTLLVRRNDKLLFA